MESYLKPLAAKVTTMLDNRYFDLNDGEQSYNVFPTNHINLINDFISIEIGKSVYSNITENKDILDNLVGLYDQATLLSEAVSDYIQINCPMDNVYRLCIGGLDSDLTSHDFKSVTDLLTYMKEYDNY